MMMFRRREDVRYQTQRLIVKHYAEDHGEQRDAGDETCVFRHCRDSGRYMPGHEIRTVY